MATVQDIIKILEQWYPPQLAESWDRIGLQVGSRSREVKTIYLTLDVDLAAVKQAVKMQADLILSHHPFLFSPLHHLTEPDAKTEIVKLLLKHDISVYVMHTNLDYAPGGTCHYLAGLMGLLKIKPLASLDTMKFKKIAVFVPESHILKVSTAMFSAGAGIIGDYTDCSFRLKGSGSFRGSRDSNPFSGKPGVFETVEEIRLEVMVPEHLVNAVIGALRGAHPYEEPAYDIYPLENTHPKASQGVYGQLPKPIKLGSFGMQLKKNMKLDALRMVGDSNTLIKSVAVVTGSGGDFIKAALRRKCDVLVTGDLKYHQSMDALTDGLNLLDVGHYPSEAIYLPELERRLKEYLSSRSWKLKTIISTCGKDIFQHL